MEELEKIVEMVKSEGNESSAKVVYYETDGSVVECRPDEIHD